MELRGWGYVGRNIDDSLHTQYRIIVDSLSDETFLNERTWGTPLQSSLAARLGTSAGQVRTIKRICEDLRLLHKGSLNMKSIPDSYLFLTEAGEKVYRASKFEENIDRILDVRKREKARSHIKGLYEEGYTLAMAYYFYEFNTTPRTRLHPLRATLKAFARYGTLDKWEWYLLNTDIRADDNPEMESLLHSHISAYRHGELSFSMNDVIEKPKGHQYFPQFLQYAGLVNLHKGRDWKIADNGNKVTFKNHVLSETFLDGIYTKG